MQANNQIPWISTNMDFPSTETSILEFSEYNGLLAASDRLNTEMLIRAYKKGIFPWSGKGQPILWWSPHPRMVLKTRDLIVSTSLRKKIRKELNDGIELTCDKAFLEVINACSIPRLGQKTSWITPEIINSYHELHDKKLAHSIEVWKEKKLVGGLYTVAIGKMIFGESMFHRRTDASKIALAALVKWLEINGGEIIDCQQETKHLENLGAKTIPREKFEKLIKELMKKPDLPWSENPPETKILY